ncbi:MAG: hypothetical protein L6Q37_04725 [Bdellovibrionaceae bacterium]|nr:hypothetical protein [Pseudobdellovibrionaceae bacterium]NUM59978.1 hypothetical protein [Pseudobdellovibrionaceae bacterium]
MSKNRELAPTIKILSSHIFFRPILFLVSFNCFSLSFAAPLVIDTSPTDSTAQKVSSESASTKKENPEDVAMSKTLETILNSIQSVGSTIELNLTTSSKVIAGKEKSELAINLLRLSPVVKFDKNMTIETAEKKDSTGRKFIPSFVLETAGKTLVSSLEIQKKSTFEVLICDAYRPGASGCINPDDPKNSINISLNNQAFGNILGLKLKKIKFDIEDESVSGGNQKALLFKTFKIAGTCSAEQRVNNSPTQPTKDVWVTAICEFKGFYSTNPEVGYSLNAKFLNKK